MTTLKRENPSTSKNSADFDSSVSIDELVQFRDHRCMDTRANYDMNHAELEKSFGVKLNGSEKKLWSRLTKGPGKHKLKRKGLRSDFSEDNATVKRRILNRSSVAAASYFQRLHLGIQDESPIVAGDYSSAGTRSILTMTGGAFQDFGSAVRLTEANLSTDSSGDAVVESLEFANKDNDYLNSNLNIVHDPFLSTSGRLEKSGKLNRNPSSESLMEKANGGDGNLEVNVEGLHVSMSQKGDNCHESDPNEVNPSSSIDRLGRMLHENTKFLTLYENMSRRLFGRLSSFLKKLKSTSAPKFEVVEEHVEGTELLPKKASGRCSRLLWIRFTSEMEA